jgi:hypothetical protein
MVARMRFSVTFIRTLPIMLTGNSIHALVCYTHYWICIYLRFILQVVTYFLVFLLTCSWVCLFRMVTILFLRVLHCLHDALPAYVIRYSLVFMLLIWMVGGCKLCVSQDCVLCLCVMISAFCFLQELLVVGI